MDARAGVRRPPRADARQLSTVRVAIAQCAPALGAVHRNLEMHRAWIAKARDAGAGLVIFPELSLTGYYLKDLAADVACAADDPVLAPICEDLWHVSTPYLLAAAGASLVFCPSASPGRGVAEGGDLGTAESCRLMDRFYAQYLTIYVVYANRVGHEDGIAFWGGSEIVAPDGTVVARAPEFDEHLLVGEIDTELVARERARNPLLRDAREDIVLRNLASRLGLPLDRRD